MLLLDRLYQLKYISGAFKQININKTIDICCMKVMHKQSNFLLNSYEFFKVLKERKICSTIVFIFIKKQLFTTTKNQLNLIYF